MPSKCFQFYVRLKDSCGVDHDPRRAVNKEWQELEKPIFLQHATPEEIIEGLRKRYELFEFAYKVIQPPGPEDCPDKKEPGLTITNGTFDEGLEHWHDQTVDWNAELKKLK